MDDLGEIFDFNGDGELDAGEFAIAMEIIAGEDESDSDGDDFDFD